MFDTKTTLTVEQMADELQISRPKAYELIHAVDGPPVLRIGRCVRVPADGLQAWIQRQSDRGNAS